MDEKDVIRTEDSPALKWEKRIVTWFIAGAVGYICSIAMGIDSKIQVLFNDVKHIIAADVRQTGSIENNIKVIQDHEKRLTTVEVKVNNLKKDN